MIGDKFGARKKSRKELSKHEEFLNPLMPGCNKKVTHT